MYYLLAKTLAFRVSEQISAIFLSLEKTFFFSCSCLNMVK